jgi:hypothetical protein
MPENIATFVPQAFPYLVFALLFSRPTVQKTGKAVPSLPKIKHKTVSPPEALP